MLLGECKAKGKTYHYQIRDSEGECRSIEGKGRRTYPIVRSRGGGEAVGPWGNRDGGGEVVRVQQRRRRGRAGAGQAAGASAASRGVAGVRGVGRRRRSRLADAGAGHP